MQHIGRRLTTFRVRHSEFERLGLQSTEREPLRVYCKSCGLEIDPLKPATEPRGWWRCPRGCNAGVH